MLGKLIGQLARRGTEVIEHPPSSAKKSQTSLRVSQSTSQHHSRLSNDYGNDDFTAPPSKTVKLKSVKTPQEIRKANDGEKLSEMAEIRTTTHDHYKVMGDTETGLAKAERNNNSSSKSKPTTLAKLLQGSEFVGMVNHPTGVLRDPSTGLCCMLKPLTIDEFGKVKKYALCFPGLGAKDMVGAQLSTCIQQFLGVGSVPPMYEKAFKLAQFLNVKMEEDNQQLELTGHSMGGGIANYVGIKLDLPSVCFNAAALGRACLKDIGEVKMTTLINQKHIRLEDDFATHPSALRKLIAFFTLGSKTYVPRNVGAIYEIKSEDQFYPSHHDWSRRHLLDSMSDWYAQKPISKLFG